MTEVNNEVPTEVELKIDANSIKVLEVVQNWHTNANEQLMTLIDNAKEGVTLDLGGEMKILLTEDMAKGFKTGLLIVKSLFGTLPFNLTPPEDPVEAEVSDLSEV